MDSNDIDREKLKKLAVEGAMSWIEDHFDLNSGLRVGIGSGSTVSYSFPKFAEYANLTAVPTSDGTREELKKLGVDVEQLREADDLVFDIDGADEVDPQLNLIKGGGGCHYREKRVAKRSRFLLIVVDQTKLVDYLGQTFPLPVEISPKAVDGAREALSRYGNTEVRITGDRPFKTDNGNLIIDVDLSKKVTGEALKERELEINEIDGVIENGLFVERKADLVFVGTEDGVRIIGDKEG